MTQESNVVALAPKPTIPEPPAHMKPPQKAAWRDIATASVEACKPENRFTLEMAATLMAKFRKGRPAMTATEAKQMKAALVQLGLAKDEGSGGPGKQRKNAKYFD